MIVLLDTNVVLRWVNPLDGRHAEIAAAIEAIRDAGHTPAVVPQVLYELWVVATRPTEANGLGKSSEETEETHALIANTILPLLLTLDDTPAILPAWLDLVSGHTVQGKPAHDARIVAAMLCHEVTHLVTFNASDFARYSEITVTSPESILANGLV